MRLTINMLALVGVAACGGTTSPVNTQDIPRLPQDQPTLNDEILERINTPTPVEQEPDPTPDPTPTPDPEPEPEPVVEPDPEPSDFDLFAASVDDFNTRAIAVDLETIDVTPDANFQVSGSADFEGFLIVNINPFAAFSAPIDLALDFDDATITAEHGQFYFVEQVPTNVTAYDGELRLIRGAIGENGVNDLDIDVRGTLRNGDSRLRVSANLDGAILGDNGEGMIIRTPQFGGENFTITLDDDDPALSSVIITALPVTP